MTHTVEPEASGSAPRPGELRKGLKQRHLTMIAIGGVIGAGLFVGSGAVITEAGPGAFLTYLVTGGLIVLVMRMLGEMATANPSTGSFSDYSRMALGGWAGFSVAWLYWYFWVIVVGFEAVAGAQIITYWFDAPLWLLSLGLMVLMTGTNLVSVSSYGEFEYWFASIKVAAIVVFLVLGTLFVLGLWPGQSFDVSNLTDEGGFLPNGVGAIFSSIVVVVFSMVGAEIATVAAAESHDPEKAIARATQSVIVRVLTFYVGSALLLVCILPWNDNELGASPFVAAFTEMGIPYADDLMNAVVLTAVLSCLNSGLYTASRMLFVLGARREAPLKLITVNSRGVPVWAILASTVVGFLSVIAAYVSPDTVFLFLLNSSGAVILFVYLLIAVSQFVLRRRTDEAELTVKMWLFPWLTLVAARGHRPGAAADGVQRRHPVAAAAQPAVLRRRARALRRHAVARRLGVDRGGRGDRRGSCRGPGAGSPGAGAGQPDADGRGAARRAGASCPGASRPSTYVVVPPTRSTPVRPSGRARRSCGRRRRRPPTGGSRRPWRCCAIAGSPSTASWATTDPWWPWSRRCVTSPPTTW